MKEYAHTDEVLMLVTDARMLMSTIRFEMFRHTICKVSFPPHKREWAYGELETMKERLASVDTDTMQSRMSREQFVVFKAKVLLFEHEVIDFVNLFHIRVISRVSGFQRDLPSRKSSKIGSDLCFFDTDAV